MILFDLTLLTIAVVAALKGSWNTVAFCAGFWATMTMRCKTYREIKETS